MGLRQLQWHIIRIRGLSRRYTLVVVTVGQIDDHSESVKTFSIFLLQCVAFTTHWSRSSIMAKLVAQPELWS